ncbi:MFS transporter [Streptomyces montanisoli]|uniref:MFS transporter n=1 Tax=Streptomyces montanisoli TaxID=2798581 RepID=A0A940MHG8_9ACTN|nr:MFS transporter [Streptomyces montanisoli]MBP0460145.1 MFS transporter [Streptomyces montanisoli]
MTATNSASGPPAGTSATTGPQGPGVKAPGPSRSLLPLLVAAALLLTLAGSALKNTMQVYFLPMADSFGGSRGDLAIATTLFAVTVAVASPLVGGISDRIGGAATLAVGTALAGASFIGCALTGQLWLFVLVYGAVAALAYSMLSYVPLGVFVDQLFQDGRKGIVYALLTNGAALGFIILVPLWSWLSTITTWRQVLLVTGLAFLLVLTPLAVLVARRSARMTRAAADEDSADRPQRMSFAARLAVAARHRELRVLAAAFFACGVTMAFIDVHFMPMMHDDGMSHSTSSTTMMLLGVFEVIGGLLAGWLCDRGAIKSVLIGAYALRGAAMLLIATAPFPVPVLLFGVIFGVSYLATVVATAMWAARVLPPEVRGTGMSLVWTVHAFGTALCSEAGAVVADATHSYLWVTSGCAALAAVACLLVTALRDPRHAAYAAPAPAGAGAEPDA